MTTHPGCAFAHDDGAYVLGALSPAERLAFKQHLSGCEECTRSVARLAGLPGLLGRVDAVVLEEPPVDDPPPTLLPALVAEARRTRRRRTLVTAGLAAAAVLVVAVPVGVWQALDDSAPSDAPDAQVSQEPAAEQPMDPVGNVPVQATVSLEEVTWGTRVGLTCTNDPAWGEGDLPSEADYELFVRTRGGRLEQVGSWRSVGGREMHITGATATTPADLAAVEVRTTDGRVVLRLGT